MTETSTLVTKTYKPSIEQLKRQRDHRFKIEEAYKYRRKFEAKMLESAYKWNMVAPQGLEGTPNYVIPISRMATNTGIVSMRQRLPKITIIPEGKDEKRLAELIEDASEHVHNIANFEAVLDQGIVDYAVPGNMVLESYVEIPYKAKRVPIIVDGKKTGEYKTIYVRDWYKPKIGTRARSIWECAFDPNARTPAEVKYVTFQERITKEQFDEKYKNDPDADEKYINLDCVEAGKIWSFNDQGELERSDATHDKIVIDHIQCEYTDIWCEYANGVLIKEISLSECHAHGKCTLTLIPNHHVYDKNGKTHALYGVGDPVLLAELDDLINSATNMFILNYKNKSTNVVSVEGSGIDVGDIDLMSGTPIQGKVTVQSLGVADLNEFIAFKETCEEWAIQSVKKNYKRLEGEVAQTAYEAAQKKQDENIGMSYQIAKMESGGLKLYYKKHLSDILDHFTEEEWADIEDVDVESIKEMIKAGEVTEDEIIYDSEKKPIKVKYISKFRTSKKYKEKIVDGKRTIDGLEIEDAHHEGWLPATKEYLTTKKWKLFKQVPDFYLNGATMLGSELVNSASKIDQVINRLSILADLMLPQPDGKSMLEKFGLDKDKVIDEIFRVDGLRKDQFDGGDGNKKLKGLLDIARQAKEVITSPQQNVLPQATQAIPPNASAPQGIEANTQQPTIGG